MAYECILFDARLPAGSLAANRPAAGTPPPAPRSAFLLFVLVPRARPQFFGAVRCRRVSDVKLMYVVHTNQPRSVIVIPLAPTAPNNDHNSTCNNNSNN